VSREKTGEPGYGRSCPFVSLKIYVETHRKRERKVVCCGLKPHATTHRQTRVHLTTAMDGEYRNRLFEAFANLTKLNIER
jgi:hypothetical protein